MPIITCPNCGTKNRIDERASELQPVCGRCHAKLAASSKPLHVTDASFARDVLSAGNTPVLLDCWAPWCGPCRMLAPTIDALAASADGRFIVGKLNTDENPQTAGRFNISSIPTLLIFKNGQVVDQIVGLQSQQAIMQRLMGHV